MRILITGGAGVIGSNTCRVLLESEGAEIIVIDDLSTGQIENLSGIPVELVEGSILDTELLQQVMVGVDTVIHLAARPSVPRSIAHPLQCHEINSTGTVNVLEAARGADVGHFVFASSSSVYGSNPVLPRNEDLVCRPMSPYAASKLAAESYVLAWAESYGMSVLAFRFFNVFGPNQPTRESYPAVVPAFIAAAATGAPLPVEGDGTQTRDFTFVGDLANVLASASRRRIAQPLPVNLAFGTSNSLLDVIGRLETIFGESMEIEFLPPRIGDVKHSQASSDVFRGLFPEIIQTEFGAALEATVEWFRKHPHEAGLT